MAKINRSRVAWFLTISALAAVAVVAAHKGGHHAHIPKDKAHANVDPSKAGDCPFHAAGGAGAVASTKEKGGDDQEMRILPIFDADGNIAGSKADDDQDQSHFFVDKDAYRRAKDAGEEDEVSSSRMKALFAFLFPGSPMVNSLLGTTYISLIPNLLLYFVPPDIKPESLNTLVAFAVGGLLGDVFLHLLPHSFLGEVHDGDFYEVSEVRNVVVGLALFVGFFIFFCIDKIMRVLSGGEGGHSHSHGHDHGHAKKVDGEDEHHHAHSHDHDHKHEDSTLRQRKGGDVKEGSSDKVAKDEPKKEISNSIKLSAYLNLIADATHNFTDGLAMAASFYTSPAIGATTTVAVFFHEIPHEVGDYAILIQSGFPRSKAMMSQFITAIGAFLGTFAGIAIEEMSKSKDNIVGGVVEAAKPLALFGFESIPMRGGDLVIPFTAGGFLYIATVGVIPELLNVSGKLGKDIRQFGSEIVAMMIGVGMMVVIALNE